jgi:hypothetical protein
MYDFLDWQNQRMAMHENYILCAANADQGTRDHWNNPYDKTYSVIDFVEVDMQNGSPVPSRIDIDRKIRDFKAGSATESEVKEMIRSYMETN